MNLRQRLGRERGMQDDDLNITPVMNIFLILVPFLLLTAVFVRIAILEFSLPSTENQANKAQRNPATKPVVTIVAITEKGFRLKTEGASFPLIAKQQDAFDYDGLVKKLQEVKKLHRETEDIIIAPEAQVRYETIIKVMDRCRENGFPNISISG